MATTPLPASIAVGKLPGLKEPQLLEGPDQRIWLIWLEQRPQEKGRTTALIRPFGAGVSSVGLSSAAPKGRIRAEVRPFS